MGYDVVQIVTDENVSELLTWKSQFPFPTMIEVYVKLTRSEKEILCLLNTLIAITIQDSITSTEAIIYCGGPIQRATIIESRNGYGLTYKCVNPNRMSIPNNCSFNKLFHNILEILQYGDRKQVREINYYHPFRVVNKKLVHEIVQIQNHVDVQQMINRWKTTQLLNPKCAT